MAGGTAGPTTCSGAHLDVARCPLGVSHCFRPSRNLAFDQYDRFRAERRRRRTHLRGAAAGVERHLNDAGAVAHVDEREPSQIAVSMHPPAQPHLAACVSETKRSAQIGA
jgi:hypothetical protein